MLAYKGTHNHLQKVAFGNKKMETQLLNLLKFFLQKKSSLRNKNWNYFSISWITAVWTYNTNKDR